jgi:hypothetical protein
LYCGYRREPGKRRTSATAVIDALCKISTNASIGRVECPTVQIVERRSDEKPDEVSCCDILLGTGSDTSRRWPSL